MQNGQNTSQILLQIAATHYSVTSDKTISVEEVQNRGGGREVVAHQYQQTCHLISSHAFVCQLSYSLTKSSKPSKVPTNSRLGDFITTQIFEPTQRSTSSRGRICEMAGAAAGADCVAAVVAVAAMMLMWVWVWGVV